jgi:hypothetical protein
MEACCFKTNLRLKTFHEKQHWIEGLYKNRISPPHNHDFVNNHPIYNVYFRFCCFSIHKISLFSTIHTKKTKKTQKPR